MKKILYKIIINLSILIFLGGCHNLEHRKLFFEPNNKNIVNKKIIIIKGVGGRDYLHKKLSRNNYIFNDLDIYERELPCNINNLSSRIFLDITHICVTSIAVLDNFIKISNILKLEISENITFIAGNIRIAAVVRERFLKNVDKMDSVTGHRAKLGLDVSSVDYIIAKNRVLELEKITKHYFLKFDALISPTTIMQALSINDTQSTEEMHERSLLASANTQPVNIFGACAITYPIQSFCNNYDSEKTLPIGLQIICGRDQDNKAVEIALSFEEKFGEPTLPNIKNFL